MATKEKNAETEVAQDAATETLPATVEQVDAETGEVTDAPAEAVPSEGVRARRAFMLKQFVPNPDWINTNIVAKGKGHKHTVGRIFGIATGFERKQNEVQGRIIESIAIKGVFQSDGYVTGEKGEASVVFFPMAYAEKLAALFESDASIKMIEVDTDIGIEATGKTIPYEWVVTAFVEGEEMAVLKRLRNARGRPQNLLTAPAPLAIEG